MEYEYLLVFIAGFLQTGLKALQILNAVKYRRVLAFFTSLGISYTWAYGVILIVSDPMKFVHATALGCALGFIFTMTLERRVEEKRHGTSVQTPEED